MKVLMWGRYGLLDYGGGDKIQIENTAHELRKIGVDVDISTDSKVDISSYDIVHLFQLDWTPETYFYAKKAKKAGKLLVLSPIHHSVKEVKRFDDEYVFGYRRIIKHICKDQHSRDTWKNIYRSLSNFKKVVPTVVSIFMGLKNMHTKTLEMSDVVLVQTELEAKDLIDTYGVEIKWKKIPNGVSDMFINKAEYENNLGISGYILCVGRIEARKNQLNIIKAVEKLMLAEEIDVNLVFVGRKSETHREYVRKFDGEASKNNWIVYVDHTSYEEMPSLYHFAKVCVSASWFETSGLTSIEALFCGANVVASGDRAKEFLRDMAEYCDPGDISSIAKAIKKQYSAERPIVPEWMKKEYTWENCARRTLEAYKETINANC